MRARFSEPKGQTGQGVDPRELWGIAGEKPKRHRGEGAKARRKAKKAAKMKGVTLKSYLRKQGKQ
jgi:hypothetical protein